MISCFETVTQHISGQPFCNMSMEALEMMVKHAKHILFCRLAKSGEVYMCLFVFHLYICVYVFVAYAVSTSCLSIMRTIERRAP